MHYELALDSENYPVSLLYRTGNQYWLVTRSGRVYVQKSWTILQFYPVLIQTGWGADTHALLE